MLTIVIVPSIPALVKFCNNSLTCVTNNFKSCFAYYRFNVLQRTVYAQAITIEGVWLNEERNAKIQIYRPGDNTIVKLFV